VNGCGKTSPFWALPPFFGYSSKRGYKTLSARQQIVSEASKLIAKLENSPTSE